MRDKIKLEFDRYEIGIIIRAVNDMRNKLKEDGKDVEVVNEILLKIIAETDKKKVFSKTLKKDNVRTY